jgi:hypothetical protein
VPQRFFDLYPDASEIPLAANMYVRWATYSFDARAPFFSCSLLLSANVVRRYPPEGMPAVAFNPTGNCTADTPMPDEYARKARRAYMAAISYMDSFVGEILEALEDSGRAQDTLVVFARYVRAKRAQEVEAWGNEKNTAEARHKGGSERDLPQKAICGGGGLQEGLEGARAKRARRRRGRERSEQEEEGARAKRARGRGGASEASNKKKGRERSEQEEEGARAKRARRRRGCCYPSLMGERKRSEQEEEGLLLSVPRGLARRRWCSLEEGAAAIRPSWARSK